MNVIALKASKIRIRSISLAIRISDVSTGYVSLLMFQQGAKWNLPAVLLEEKGTVEPLIALLEQTRGTICAPHGLSEVHQQISNILEHRNLSRFVGGGTYYVPYVTIHGYQSFDAYVVVDLPKSILPEMLPTTLHLFHYKSSAEMLAWHDAVEGKRLMLALLRLRYQVQHVKKVKQ